MGGADPMPSPLVRNKYRDDPSLKSLSPTSYHRYFRQSSTSTFLQALLPNPSLGPGGKTPTSDLSFPNAEDYRFGWKKPAGEDKRKEDLFC